MKKADMWKYSMCLLFSCSYISHTAGVYRQGIRGSRHYWKQIHEAAGKPDFSFIVGDFNVNDFLYPTNNELHKLEINYDRLIDKDVITQNQALTSIDNIFVKKGISSNAKITVWDYCYIPETKGYAIRNTRYSDHNICICEIEI